MLTLLPEEHLKSARMHVLLKTEIENPIQDLLPLWVTSFPKSSGRRNACSCCLQELWMDRGKRNPSLSFPLPATTQNSIFGWKEAFDTETRMHTHTRVLSCLPVTCLLLAVPPSRGAGAAETTGAGEIPSPFCGWETKWIKWTRFWRSLRSHRGGGRDGERNWGWRRKGRAGNSVTRLVCAVCTSVPVVRKRERSCSPGDNVPVWYPLLTWQESFLQPATAVMHFKGWKMLVGEAVRAGNWDSWVSFINLLLLARVAFCTSVEWGSRELSFWWDGAPKNAGKTCSSLRFLFGMFCCVLRYLNLDVYYVYLCNRKAMGNG